MFTAAIVKSSPKSQQAQSVYCSELKASPGHLYQQLAEVRASQEPFECWNRVFQSIHNILAILDLGFTKPLRHLTKEVFLLADKIAHDEAGMSTALRGWRP